jgi:hypothetical protein
MPSKPDIYMVDGSFPEHQEFLEYMASIIETETFKGLSYWTDGALLDEAIKRFPALSVKNLSDKFGKEKDPIYYTAFNEYVET